MAQHSVLRRRIILINLVVFVLLMTGVVAVQSSREGLVDERLTGVTEQARIVTGTLAEYATDSETRTLVVQDAAPLMRELLAPTNLRARLYDTNGALVIDTRNLLARNIVQTEDLPPIDDWSLFTAWLSRLYDSVLGVRPFAKLDPYFEAGEDGRAYHEVKAALQGDTASAERLDEQNKMVLSVAIPVQRFKAIYGVLFVSTEEGDIDDILREERATLIEYFLLAFVVMMVSGLYLSGVIADPIRRLAGAADLVRSGAGGREALPDMPGRDDEIGDLAVSLSAMTKALYNRIDAIESFAADVAHELKNPLTSLRSAVEMLARANIETDRKRLTDVVRADVKRIDRLITDISASSRLDAEMSREPREPVPIGKLLETIMEVYSYMELPNDVKLKLELRLPSDALVMGRDERLGQVVRNLIDNAISFSPKDGIVSLSAWVDLGRVRIAVEDEGPGIPSDSLEKIFRRFYTSRPAEQGFGKNSGLGLSIARQIVGGHNGKIWAENRDKGGARFLVELPLAFLDAP
jgi:two-component system, OmpR family, sensor histidine kinase ChvG